jgi:gluconate 5-dehydrogenase
MNESINRLFDLTGKTALITGSSRGLGLTIARGLAMAGATVVLNGTQQPPLEQAVESLREQGLEASGRCFDVTDAQAVAASVEAIEREIGPIGILVNNAGLQRRAPFLEMSLDDFRKVLDVNLTGAFIVGQSVARRMVARRSGKIINILSLNAVMARPSLANYCSAKGGLGMLTKSMATEWGRFNVTVNAIGPGYFKTDMTRILADDPAFDAWVRNKVPLGRWGEPEELIGAAVFLSSSASDYVNGHAIFVDGGWLACL